MKIVVLAPFNVIPPNFGGAERILNLARRLGPITLIALNWDGIDQEGQLDEMKYRLISAEPEAVEQAKKLIALGIQTYDGIPSLTKNNLKKLRLAIEEENPDLIVLEHPWLVSFVGDVPFVYDAHNAEHFLTTVRWPHSYDEQIVEEVEREAVTKAVKVAVCSEVDAALLKKHYEVDKEMVYIPNGTDLPAKAAEGKEKNLIFIGSLYGPNIRAAQELANLANKLPDYTIQILGPCAKGVESDAPNVQLVGSITEEQKDNYFQNAYAFINLVTTGSGTNLKNARAMAYGLPVIATKVGARGFPTAIQVKNPAELTQALSNLDWPAESKKNRQFAETITWEKIGEAYRGLVLASLP